MGGPESGSISLRSLSTFLDGKIEVESILGEGSTFTVTLPLDVSETSHPNLPKI